MGLEHRIKDNDQIFYKCPHCGSVQRLPKDAPENLVVDCIECSELATLDGNYAKASEYADYCKGDK